MAIIKKLNGIPFDSKIAKMRLEDFEYTNLILSEMKIKGSKLNIFDSINLFFEELPSYFESEILLLFLVLPFDEDSYKAFVYLKNKSVVPLQFLDKTNIEQFNSIYIKPDSKDRSIVRMHKIIKKDGSQGFFINGIPKSIGNYIVEYAPKEFKTESLNHQQLKEDYLKEYINTNGAAVNLDQLKNQFIAYLNKNQHKAIETQNNDSIFQEFNSISNYLFPKELQALFEIHNGVENTGFLTAKQILIEWKIWKSIFDDINWTLLYLTENNYSDDNKTLGIYTNPYWIPFYAIGDGNFYAIDYAPNKKGASGQIIRFGADTDTIHRIASDISDFMQQVLNNEITLY